MLSRHTTHRKVHEPPTGVSRALEVTPFKFLLKRMVKQDFLAGRKPLGESERAWLCKSAESCSLRACGSSSVCEREKALEDSSNSLVGMSACIGSDSLVGMSAACVGSNSLVGMSAACVGSNSLVGMSACVGSDSLVGVSLSGECGGADSSVGMSLSVRDQSFCDFGAGESNAPSSQRALNAQETRCTGGIIKAVGTMMRMLLIWLLAFSTFVGVGCEEIGPSPTASLLDKYYLAPSSSLLDSEYLAFSFRWHGFQPRCVAKCILFRSWEYEVILGGTNRRNSEGCRSSITILAPGASRAGWLCGVPQQFLQRAWVDGSTVKPPLCGRPRAGGGGGYSGATNLMHRIYSTSGGAGESTKGLCPRCRDPYCGPHRGALKEILYGKRRRILEPYGVEPGSVPRPACGSDLRYEYRYHQLRPCGAARRGGIRKSRLRRSRGVPGGAPNAYGHPKFRLCGAVGYRSIQPRNGCYERLAKAQLSSPRDGFGYDPCHGNPSTNGFGDTVTDYECFSSCPCLKESRGQDRGQQGKGTFPGKVWACGVYCPEDVGSSSRPCRLVDL